MGQLARRVKAMSARAEGSGGLTPEIAQPDLDRILELGAGGPLVLEELTRYYAVHGRVAATSSAKQVFEAQLAQLDADARLVLRAASLVGDAFWPGCVEAMLRDVGIDVKALLGRLEAEELVTRHPSRIAGQEELRVRHALLREAAMDASSEEARGVLHRKG
jgi:predicted ATPase